MGDHDNSLTYDDATGNEDWEEAYAKRYTVKEYPYNDFHLQPGSPCIDTGTDRMAPPIDLDGVMRPQGFGYDMGAYEYVVPAVPPSFMAP